MAEARVVPSRLVVAFAVSEIVCVVGFFVLLWRGHDTIAVACLLGPLQLLAFAFLMKQELWLLTFLAALIPFTALEILPHAYVHLVLLPLTFGLLLVVRLTQTWLTDHCLAPRKLAFRERAPLVLLGTLAVVSHVAAVLRGRPVSGWFQFVLTFYFLLAVWFFATTPRSLRQVRLLVYAMIPGYIAVCLLLPVFASRVEGGLLGKTLITSFSVVNLNSLAAHVGVLAAVVLGTALDAGRTGRRLAFVVATFLLLAALLFTKSRGAWLGFGVAFLYVLMRTRSLPLLLLAAVGAIGMYSMDFLRMSFVVRLQATGAADPSLWGRFLLWKYAWVVFKDNWLVGVGMQNYRLVKFLYGFPWPRSFGLPYNSHNLFLEFLTDLGIPGFVSLVWLKAVTFLQLDRTARRPVEGRGLAIGLNAGLIVYAVHGLLDCVIWQHGAFVLLGMLLGLAIAVHRVVPSTGRAGSARIPGAVSATD